MAKTNPIKFSIIIATANSSDDLVDMLNSLKDCGIFERKDTEILIVNNRASNAEHVQKICKQFNLAYFFEPFKGQSSAQNHGIHKAQGKYIVFTDDDAIINDSQWLDKLEQHFKNYPDLGFVAGNVKAITTKSDIQSMWEKKGGLSKGDEFKYYSREFFAKFRFSPWPINKMAAGCNCMFPREILKHVGMLNPMMTTGRWFTNGDILGLVYKIIRNGNTITYDPSIVVYHKHPENPNDLKSRLFIYGTGNTAYQLYIFFTYIDVRSLWWGLFGHHIYVLRNLIKSFFGKYPLKPEFVIYSLMGSIVGTFLFFIKLPAIIKYGNPRNM